MSLSNSYSPGQPDARLHARAPERAASISKAVALDAESEREPLRRINPLWAINVGLAAFCVVTLFVLLFD